MKTDIDIPRGTSTRITENGRIEIEIETTKEERGEDTDRERSRSRERGSYRDCLSEMELVLQ